MHRVLYILLLFVVFPVSAQNRFITLNWQELPAAQTLPEAVETIPLPDDFRFYTYHVKIEFPEFVDLDPEAAAELTRKKVNLPDYPQAETSVGVAAYEGILSVRFVPVVHRGGVYQRINSFKLSVISTGSGGCPCKLYCSKNNGKVCAFFREVREDTCLRFGSISYYKCRA